MGPKPTPVKVGRESHKIKKTQRVPPPVIIYTVSPKVIHTTPSEFMSLVQRLTGATDSRPILTPPLPSTRPVGLIRPIAQKLCPPKPDESPFIDFYHDQHNYDEDLFNNDELFKLFEHNYDDFGGSGSGDSAFSCPLEFLTELLYQ